MKAFIAQFPLGRGVAVVTARGPAEIKPLLLLHGLAEAFSRDLIETCSRALSLGTNEETLAVYSFNDPTKQNKLFRAGFAVIHLGAPDSRGEDNGKAVFVFYEEGHKERAEQFALGVFEQIKTDVERKLGKCTL